MTSGLHNIHYTAQSRLASCLLALSALGRWGNAAAAAARVYFYTVLPQLVNFAGSSPAKEPLHVRVRVAVVADDPMAVLRLLAASPSGGRAPAVAVAAVAPVCDLRARDAGMGSDGAAAARRARPFQMVDQVREDTRRRVRAMQRRRF